MVTLSMAPTTEQQLLPCLCQQKATQLREAALGRFDHLPNSIGGREYMRLLSQDTL